MSYKKCPQCKRIMKEEWFANEGKHSLCNSCVKELSNKHEKKRKHFFGEK
ncbi:hypothetical protein PQC38_gp069 [Aeromonas phage BUCT695]|nr:hypothetical protein PQC38_gp069 [Aeromonas phage BUCT695]UIW10545.1 hypothetical protein [Aeromonas phage BUCT695]